MELRNHLDYQKLESQNKKYQKMGWKLLNNGMLLIDISLIGFITYIWVILFFYNPEEWKFNYASEDINLQIILLFLTAIASPFIVLLWLCRKCVKKETLGLVGNSFIYVYFLTPIILNNYNLNYYLVISFSIGSTLMIVLNLIWNL